LMPPNKNKKAKIAAGTCVRNFIFKGLKFRFLKVGVLYV
jgi:hypothetical protein